MKDSSLLSHELGVLRGVFTRTRRPGSEALKPRQRASSGNAISYRIEYGVVGVCELADEGDVGGSNIQMVRGHPTSSEAGATPRGKSTEEGTGRGGGRTDVGPGSCARFAYGFPCGLSPFPFRSSRSAKGKQIARFRRRPHFNPIFSPPELQ